MRPIIGAAAFLLALAGPAAEAGGPGRLDGDAYRLMRYWCGTIWNQDFRQGTALALDLTCDGRADRVFAWRDGVNPEGEYFQVALVADPPGPEAKDGDGWERLPDVSAGLPPPRLEVGTKARYALRDNRVGPHGSGFGTTVVPPPREARARFGPPDACMAWLKIDDGMCDAIHVGYDPTRGMFVLDRN